jgi:hypothetical protein
VQRGLGGIDREHGEIGALVLPDDLRGNRRGGVERHPQIGRARDQVGVGQQMALLVEHER